MDTKSFEITLPLVSASTRISDALEKAREHQTAAVITMAGEAFQLVSTADLKAAASLGDASRTVSGITGRTVDMLSRANAAALGLDLPDLQPNRVIEALRRLKTDAVIASIASMPRGGRIVTAFVDPTGTFQKVVRPVYICPADNEEFAGPGHCDEHDEDLVLKP